MTILVFGKTGQVATELARLENTHCLGREDANLLTPDACHDAILGHRPRAVINAAAYTAVDQAEDNEDEARAINASAPAAMARACASLSIPLIQISTDYVFDGQGTDPWLPTSPTAPPVSYTHLTLPTICSV